MVKMASPLCCSRIPLLVFAILFSALQLLASPLPNDDTTPADLVKEFVAKDCSNAQSFIENRDALAGHKHDYKSMAKDDITKLQSTMDIRNSVEKRSMDELMEGNGILKRDENAMHHGHSAESDSLWKRGNDTDGGLVDSARIRRLFERPDLQRYASLLGEFAKLSVLPKITTPNRVFGSPGHQATLDLIEQKLNETDYYNITKQEFYYDFFASEGSLYINEFDTDEAFGDEPGTFLASGGSPETGTYLGMPKAVKGQLKLVLRNGCDIDDYIGMKGKIGYVKRGECSITEKSTLAHEAGAVGLLAWGMSQSGAIHPGRIETTFKVVPTGGVGGRYGRKLFNELDFKRTKYTATMLVNTVRENRKTYNLIAETKQGNHDNIIMAGAHSDSVSNGPGVNDNGSGSMAVLEVALKLSKFKVNNAVRFAWWSAEEYGLVGSRYYAYNLRGDENIKHKMYINLDMVASPNYQFGIYDGDGSYYKLVGPSGSDFIEQAFIRYFRSVGKDSVPVPWTGGSDYRPFFEVGIPSGGLFTGTDTIGPDGKPFDPFYHQAGDDENNYNIEAWLENTKALADIIARYSVDLKGFPVRYLTPYSMDTPKVKEVQWTEIPEDEWGHGA